MIELKEMFGNIRRMKYSIDRIENQDGSRVKNPMELAMKNEVDWASKGPVDYQERYIDRIVTLEASRKIVDETFDFGSIKNGAEFGCGIYGFLYNYFMPKGTKLVQYDINPKAVKFNKKYTRTMFGTSPKIEVGNIYEMPLKDSSVDLITGLSSWDSLLFLEKSVEEVCRCLSPGGTFVHFQDLLPADKCIILTEAKKRVEKGMDSNVPLTFESVMVADGSGFWAYNHFVCIDSIEFGQVRLGEYMNKHLAGLFEKKGFEIRISEERQNESLVKKTEFNKFLRQHGYEYGNEPESLFKSAYGKNVFEEDESVPKGYIKQEAAMDVLVAQKPL